MGGVGWDKEGLQIDMCMQGSGKYNFCKCMFPTLCEEILHHLWEYYFRNLPEEFHLTWHVMHWPQPRQCLPLQIAAKSEYTTVKTLHTEICDLQKPHSASAGINPFFNCKCRVSVSISH